MGYHIILKQKETTIEHHYVEDYQSIAKYEIAEDSIIYQGEQHWKPELVKNSPDYTMFTKNWFRAGIKAQQLFKKQALAQKYIALEIPQDQKSFEQFYGISEDYLAIKRSDFILQNARGYQIDVKCMTIYHKEGHSYFDFRKDHLNKHLNMMKIDGSKVIIAVYKRKQGTDIPDPNSLRMVEVQYIVKLIAELDLQVIQKKNATNEPYRVYEIPLSRTMKKFTLIDHLLNKKELTN